MNTSSDVFSDDTYLMRRQSNPKQPSNLIFRDNRQSNNNNNNINSCNSYRNNSEIIDFNDSELVNDKAQNYQRLSHSINDLFSNLLRQLEKQKNKDYSGVINNGEIRNSCSTTNKNIKKNNSIPYVFSPESQEFKNNKFIINQEASVQELCNKSSPINNNSNNTHKVIYSNENNNKSSSSSTTTSSNLIHHNQILNDKTNIHKNEQLIQKYQQQLNQQYKQAELTKDDYLIHGESFHIKSLKYNKLEILIRHYLSYYLNKSQPNQQQYDNKFVSTSALFMINQQSLAKSVFYQLVREKYLGIEWPDDLLDKLHQIVNSDIDYDSREYNQQLDVENYENADEIFEFYRYDLEDDEDDDDDEDYHQNMFEYNQLNNNLNMYKQQFLSNQYLKTQNQSVKPVNTIDVPNSPASSSTRSYRRIKHIKNSTNMKKKINQAGGFNPNGSDMSEGALSLVDNPNDAFYTGETLNQEEILKRGLSTSFVKRRERKGSLPEINTNHLVGFENQNYDLNNSSYLSSVVNVHTMSTNGANPDGTSYLNCKNHVQNVVKNQPIFQNDVNEDLKSQSQSKNNRNSRKSAFVLEILRQSMFRSKSLTDLNSSLVKQDNYNTSINASNRHSNLLKSLNNLNNELMVPSSPNINDTSKSGLTASSSCFLLDQNTSMSYLKNLAEFSIDEKFVEFSLKYHAVLFFFTDIYSI